MRKHGCGIGVLNGHNPAANVGGEVGALLGHLVKEGLFNTLVAQVGLESNDGIAGDPRFHFAVCSILRGVVAGGMGADAVGVRLHHRGALALPGIVHQFGRHGVASKDIVAVNLNTGHAVAVCSAVERNSRLNADGNRNSPVVVLHKEHLRGLLAGGKNHGLVNIALAGGAVAKVDDDGLVGFVVAGGVGAIKFDAHRVSGCVQRLRADDQRVKVKVAESRIVGVPAAVREAADKPDDVEDVDAANHSHGVLPISGENVVLWTNGVGGAHLSTLLAVARNPQGKLTLALKVRSLGVEPANYRHVAEKPLNVVVGQLLKVGQKLFCALRRNQAAIRCEQLDHGVMSRICHQLNLLGIAGFRGDVVP